MMRLMISPTKESLDIGKINIIQKGITLEKFNLEINKSSEINQVIVDEKIIYTYVAIDYVVPIIASVIIGAMISSVCLFIRYKRKH